MIVHPFTNPDGAQLAYDLYTNEIPITSSTLDTLGLSGQDASSGGNDRSRDLPGINCQRETLGYLAPRHLPQPARLPEPPGRAAIQRVHGTRQTRACDGAQLGLQQGLVHARLQLHRQPEFPSPQGCRLPDSRLHHVRDQLEPRGFRDEPTQLRSI